MAKSCGASIKNVNSNKAMSKIFAVMMFVKFEKINKFEAKSLKKLRQSRKNIKEALSFLKNLEFEKSI